MNFLDKIANVYSRLLFYVAGAAIIVMMLLTATDVILRFFRKPITGASELAGFLGALSISFALAYTTVQKGHISVNIITRLFKERYQRLISLTTNFIGMFFLYYMSYQLFVYGKKIAESGEVSLTLQFPFHYVVYSVSLAVFSVSVIELITIINILSEIFRRKLKQTNLI